VSEGLQTRGLLRLMAWMSPAFPIGGFAYSGGLERAVHDGLVGDATGLRSWLSAILRHGSVWNDAVLFADGWRRHGEEGALHELSELGRALAGSASATWRRCRWERPSSRRRRPGPVLSSSGCRPRFRSRSRSAQWRERKAFR